MERRERGGTNLGESRHLREGLSAGFANEWSIAYTPIASVLMHERKTREGANPYESVDAS
jgi:hypothetical protein